MTWPPAEIRAVIFDLDGVLVDTARFHLAAWQRIAAEHGFAVDEDLAEQLKGVRRETALRLVADSGGIALSPAEEAVTAARKDRYYNGYLADLDWTALLPGASESLQWLRDHAVPIALASASRNASTILGRTGIANMFDAIIDGRIVAEAKPDPAAFLTAARQLGFDPHVCLVLEDAVAGVEGAIRAGCPVVGVGDPAVLTEADYVVPDLAALDWAMTLKERS